MPRDKRTLRALPGVGPYTAGALLSIAYGQDEVAVDANVARVLTRLFDYAEDTSTSAGARAVRKFARLLLPPGRAGGVQRGYHGAGRRCLRGALAAVRLLPGGDTLRGRRNGTERERPVRRPKGAVPCGSWLLPTALLETAC